MTSIVLFDDDILYRQCVSLQLSNNHKVVGETGDLCKVVPMVQKQSPDVVLLKFVSNGIIDRINQIKESSTAHIVAYSVPFNPHLISLVLKAKAAGVLLRSEASIEDLEAAIETVKANRTYFGAGVSDMISKCFQNAIDLEDLTSCFTMLTPREREVIQLIAEGGSTRSISEALNVSVKTVESHRKSVMMKLSMSSVAELTKYALREGLTSLDIASTKH